MKKALIGTSALIAVGLLTAQGAVAADKISLGLSGNYRVVGGMVSQDDGATESAANARDHGIGTDGKINFSGSTTLDSGIEVGVRVELEAQAGAGVTDTVDEHFVYIENTDVWGRLEFGDRDGADNKMNVLAPFVFGPMIVGVQTIMLASAPGAGGGNAFLSTNSAAVPVVVPGLSGDSTKITYYTPKFSGAQIGVSYTPESGENRGAGFGTAAGGTDTTATDLSEILEIGANWSGSMGDASVRVSATMANASGESASGVNVNDRDEWTAAFSVSMNGISFGAQYQNGETGGGSASTVVQRDDIEMRAGLTYGSGAWTYGVEYASREIEVSATGEDQVTIWGLGANRSLGAGISAGIGVHMWDWSDDLSAKASENDATEFFFVTQVSF
jgi:outer membrane protein OmpU